MPDIHQRITAFNAPLLPNMVQLKYKLMAQNIFTFYRGTCHLFYEDLAAAKPLPASPLAWLCGDLHLENFGSYKADNRMVYFDMNDFDEAILAPCSWEVVRLLTSILIAAPSMSVKREDAVALTRQCLNS